MRHIVYSIIGASLCIIGFVSTSAAGNTSLSCTQQYDPVCAQPLLPMACSVFGCSSVTPKTYSNSCTANNEGASILYKGACTGSGTGVSTNTGWLTCPQYLPALLTNDQINHGCQYTSTQDSNGCSVPTLKCMCPAYDLMPLTPEQTKQGCTYKSETDQYNCNVPKLSCPPNGGGGGLTCTQEYAPVCAQPPMPSCPTGLSCVQAFPPLKTYGNKCMAGLANASVLYTGECKSDVGLCKSKPELTADEKVRGCEYITLQTFAETTCPVYGLKCKVTTPICPQYLPALLTNDQINHGCQYTSTQDSNGCSVPTLKCMCPAYDLMPLTPEQTKQGCTYKSETDQYNCNVPKLSCPPNGGGGGLTCTQEYAPVCGAVQVQCIKAPCNPVQKTFGNKCMAGLANASVLYTGECKSDVGLCKSFQSVRPLTSDEKGRGCTYISLGKDTNGCELGSKIQCPINPPVLCTQEYAPVCAQPPMPSCPTGLSCVQAFPPLKTYGNKCMAGLANASVLYTGECKSDTNSGLSQRGEQQLSRVAENLVRIAKKAGNTEEQSVYLQNMIKKLEKRKGERGAYLKNLIQKELIKLSTNK